LYTVITDDEAQQQVDASPAEALAPFAGTAIVCAVARARIAGQVLGGFRAPVEA
jgi:hypothetical protein